MIAQDPTMITEEDQYATPTLVIYRSSRSKGYDGGLTNRTVVHSRVSGVQTKNQHIVGVVLL